jgi:ketosteroid isomerase-like protein
MGHNLDVVRGGYERFIATGELQVDILAPEFVWDMSHFSGWPEEQTYDGAEGTRAFLGAWVEPWDDWSIEVESLQEAGDRVLATLRQSGVSKSTGVRLEMAFAQVWTLRDGLETRMEMYSDPTEARRALGLEKPSAGD